MCESIHSSRLVELVKPNWGNSGRKDLSTGRISVWMEGYRLGWRDIGEDGGISVRMEGYWLGCKDIGLDGGISVRME